MSMYETGSGLKPYLPKGETPYPEEGIPTLQPFPPHVSKTCSLLSFAISSPLPCFHDFPSCLHPVCKPFSLFILKQFFFLILEVFFFFFQHQRQSPKSTTSCVQPQPVTSHLVQIHIQNHYPAFICCLLECCLFVRQNVVVRSRRCCYSDIL